MGKADWEQSAFSVLMIVFQTHSFIRDSFSLRHFVGDNIFFSLSDIVYLISQWN